MPGALQLLRKESRQSINAKENKQVEPRIYDAAFEIQVCQECPGMDEHPPPCKTHVVQAPSDGEDHQERDDAADRIRKSRSELTDTEDLHGDDLHPKEQRGFLPERFVIDLHTHVILRLDHLACTLGEVDLIPVEKMHLSKGVDEQDRRGHRDQGESGKACQSHAQK